jgi:hypothetical protein
LLTNCLNRASLYCLKLFRHGCSPQNKLPKESEMRARFSAVLSLLCLVLFLLCSPRKVWAQKVNTLTCAVTYLYGRDSSPTIMFQLSEDGWMIMCRSGREINVCSRKSRLNWLDKDSVRPNGGHRSNGSSWIAMYPTGTQEVTFQYQCLGG